MASITTLNQRHMNSGTNSCLDPLFDNSGSARGRCPRGLPHSRSVRHHSDVIPRGDHRAMIAGQGNKLTFLNKLQVLPQSLVKSHLCHHVKLINLIRPRNMSLSAHPPNKDSSSFIHANDGTHNIPLSRWTRYLTHIVGRIRPSKGVAKHLYQSVT